MVRDLARGPKLAIAVVLLALCVGLAIWAGYLSGRTLDEADQASSVLGGFASVIFGVAGVVVGLLGLRQHGPSGPDGTPTAGTTVMGDRAVVVGHNRGIVIAGDHARVTGLSPRAMGALGLVVALAAAASVTSVVLALRGPQQPRAAVETGAYTVTVRGSAIGGDPFDLQGELRVRPGTDGLPYGWCLKVGNPWGVPKPGAVWFGTHDTCFGAGTGRAVAGIAELDGEQILTPAISAPPSGGTMNAFTATSGLLAGAYVPDGGSVRFRPSPSRMEGSLSLQGLESITGRTTRGTLTATFTAQRVSDDPEAPVSYPMDPVFGLSEQPVPPREFPGVRYTVRTITSFTDSAGHPELTASARARFAAAVFLVDARDGGSFRYDPPNSRTDVFPITGTVTGSGPVFVLSGSRSTGEGASAASAQIGGTLDVSGSAPAVRLVLRTETGTGAASGYEVEAVLQ